MSAAAHTAPPSTSAQTPHQLQQLRRLDREPERDEFLRQYHQAVDAAHDPAGYRQLRRVPHVWSLAVIATG